MIGKLLLFLVIATVASGSPVPDEFADRSGRIVGGQNARQGQFPWYASMRTSGGGFFCGGSILSNRWVLSAAHCFQGRGSTAIPNPANFRVLVGTVMRDGSQGGVTHAVQRIVLHPQWNTGVAGQDIVVLQTTANIVFNTNTRSIELGSTRVVTGNAIAIGLGGTNGPVPTILQFVTLTITPDSQCSNADQVLCTQVPAGRGTCHGDSGGPLTQAGLQIGVAAWIRGSCGDGNIDGFMRVSAYRTWILNTIR